MTVVAATQVRAGRAAAIFAKAQSAIDTPATSFAVGNRLWTEDGDIDIGARIPDTDGGMENGSTIDTGVVYIMPDKPAGMIRIKATPASLRTVFDSNFGTFAAGAWTLVSQIPDASWITIALLEDVAGGTYKIVRLQDAWFHRVAIRCMPGALILEAEYAAWKQLNQAANAGGISVPASPAMPTDLNVFPRAKCTLTRDPAGDNVDIRFSEIRITLDQGLSHGYGMGQSLNEVSKDGPLSARIDLMMDTSDESWDILLNSLAGTVQRYQFVAITDDGTPETFTLNLYDLVWDVQPLGHSAKKANVFNGTAEARKDASGNYVSMTLA